jgi:hypothetical protein
MPGPQSFKKALPCRLSDSEVLAKGEALAAARLLIEELKAQRKVINDRISAQQDEVLELATLIDARAEERDVPCKWVDDFAHKVRKLIRQDTGEEVETQVMTAADLQADMDLGPDECTEEDFNDLDDDNDEADRPNRKQFDQDPDEHLNA